MEDGLGSLRPSSEWSSGALLVGLVPSTSYIESALELFRLFGQVLGLEPNGETMFVAKPFIRTLRGRASTPLDRVKAFVGDDDFAGVGALSKGRDLQVDCSTRDDGQTLLAVRIDHYKGGPGLVAPLTEAVESAATSMQVLAGAVDSSDTFDPFYNELWPRQRMGCQVEWYEKFVPGYFPRMYLAPCLTDGLGEPDDRLLRSSLTDWSGAAVTCVTVDAAPDDDAALWEGVRLVRDWVRPRLPGWMWTEPRKIVRPRTFEGPPVPRYLVYLAERVAFEGWTCADATGPVEHGLRSLTTSVPGAGYGDTRWRVEVDPPKYFDDVVEAIESILLSCDFAATDGWIASSAGLSFTPLKTSGNSIEWETSIKPGSRQLADLLFAAMGGLMPGFTVPSPTGNQNPVISITGTDC